MSTKFNPDDRLNTILDKISEYGIQTLTEKDIRYLDSYVLGQEKYEHNRLLEESKIEQEQKNINNIIKNSLFAFEYGEKYILEEEKSIIKVYGKLYLNDVVHDKQIIKGELDGFFVYNYLRDIITPMFTKTVLIKNKPVLFDVLYFVTDIEEEFDVFLLRMKYNIESILNDIRKNEK